MKLIDRALLASERQAPAEVAGEWPELEGAEPLALEIEPWLPARAAEEFRARFAALDRERRRRLRHQKESAATCQTPVHVLKGPHL